MIRVVVVDDDFRIAGIHAAYVDKVDSVCKVGDKMQVKVIAIDDQDRVKLSRKAVLRDQRPKGDGSPPPSQERPPRSQQREEPRRD